jgi:hypothetical protein
MPWSFEPSFSFRPSPNVFVKRKFKLTCEGPISELIGNSGTPVDGPAESKVPKGVQ